MVRARPSSGAGVTYGRYTAAIDIISWTPSAGGCEVMTCLSVRRSHLSTTDRARVTSLSRWQGRPTDMPSAVPAHLSAPGN